MINNGSGNGLVPVWHQAINWTLLTYCQLDPDKKIVKLESEQESLFEKNAFENVCNMAAILCGPECGKPG